LGVAATEMAVVIVLIAVVAFGAVRFFGLGVGNLWERSATEFEGARAPATTTTVFDPGPSGGGGSGNFGTGSTTTAPTSTTTTDP
jgi:Flp pilus assembly pilin Flp